MKCPTSHPPLTVTAGLPIPRQCASPQPSALPWPYPFLSFLSLILHYLPLFSVFPVITYALNIFRELQLTHVWNTVINRASLILMLMEFVWGWWWIEGRPSSQDVIEMLWWNLRVNDLEPWDSYSLFQWDIILTSCPHKSFIFLPFNLVILFNVTDLKTKTSKS